MKINDLFESEVDEGFGSALAAGARGLAKGAGAVAGGIAGMGSAAKQGYQAGRAAVGNPGAGGDIKNALDNINPPLSPEQEQQVMAAVGGGEAPSAGGAAAPAAGAATVRPAGAAPAEEPAAKDAGAGVFGNMTNTMRANQPPAASSTGGATQQTQTGQVHKANPNNPNNQQVAPAYNGPNWDEVTGEPLSPKAKAEYEKFTPEQKAEIEQAKANNQQQQAAPAAPATTPTAPPAEVPAAPAGRVQGGGKVAGAQSMTPGAIKKREGRAAKKAAIKTQAEVDADRARLIGDTGGVNEDYRFESKFLGGWI